MKILTIFFKMAIKYAKNCKLPVEMNTLNTILRAHFKTNLLLLFPFTNNRFWWCYWGTKFYATWEKQRVEWLVVKGKLMKSNKKFRKCSSSFLCARKSLRWTMYMLWIQCAFMFLQPWKPREMLRLLFNHFSLFTYIKHDLELKVR